jgi:hypothetical protein
MAGRLRVSTRTARSKGYARKNTTPRFTRGWFFHTGSHAGIAGSLPARSQGAVRQMAGPVPEKSAAAQK